MAGSSRSLQRALDAAFQNWDSSTQWDTSPSPVIKELYDTIYAFNERHNTSHTVHTNTNDILRAVRTDYIANSSDLSKEVFFVEVLSRLLPTLTAHHVELWLKTYLRPALDSAGFDVLYVSKTRKFLDSLTTDMLHTDDENLRQRRERIAELTMEHVMHIYVGKDLKSYDMIQLVASETDTDTQAFAERRRFIERNATGVLIDWGLQDPKKLFNLLDPHFCEAKTRLKTLALASVLVSKNVSRTQRVMDTPFFMNLLRCLCLDASEPMLRSALNVLMMLFGKVCHKMTAYLPELLCILSRLACWNSNELQTLLSVFSEHWAVAGPEKASSAVRSQLYPDRSFDLLYFITLLYGLFPKGLISFASDPNLNFLKHPPTHLTPSMLPDALFLSEPQAKIVSKSITLCLERCMIHPNFLHAVSSEAESKNPVGWILKKNANEEIGEAEVLFECLALNPEILISIPDDYVLPDKLISMIRSSDHLHSIMSSRKASVRSFDSFAEHKTGMRVMSSLSILENSGAEKRFSPSKKLSLDGSAGLDSIEFKPFTFDGSSTSQSTLNEKDKSIASLRDDLSTLFAEHEKLYFSAAPNTNDEVLRKASNGALSRRSSEKTDDLLKLSNTFVGGNTIDFYQRELLLIKNELEFSTYIKSLFRLRYVKLKLKLNSMSESMSKQREGVVRDEILNAEKAKLIELSKGLLEEKEKKLKLKAEENDLLVDRTEQMHSKIQELEVACTEAKADATGKLDELEKTASELREKEEEIVNLKNRITCLLEKRDLPVKNEREKSSEPSFRLSCNEGEFARLKTEINMLQNQKLKAESDLEHLRRTLEYSEKDFEGRLSETKLEMRSMFSEQSAQYEKKIKEMNVVLLKYEHALQEEKIRATQLLKTIPIRNSDANQPVISPNSKYGGSYWPASYRSPTSEQGGEYFGNGNVERSAQRGSHTSVESLSLSSVPSTSNTPMFASKQNSYILPRQASSASMPIVKGRGGYQKRSKKLM